MKIIDKHQPQTKPIYDRTILHYLPIESKLLKLLKDHPPHNKPSYVLWGQ